MPIYEYECSCGKITEEMHKITDIPQEITCECGNTAKKILSSRGAIQTDNDVIWLESAVKTLQPSYERPITTRGEYNKYLKEKGLACIG